MQLCVSFGHLLAGKTCGFTRLISPDLRWFTHSYSRPSVSPNPFPTRSTCTSLRAKARVLTNSCNPHRGSSMAGVVGIHKRRKRLDRKLVGLGRRVQAGDAVIALAWLAYAYWHKGHSQVTGYCEPSQQSTTRFPELQAPGRPRRYCRSPKQTRQ